MLKNNAKHTIITNGSSRRLEDARKKMKKDKRNRTILIISLSLILIYFLGVIVFSNLILPNTFCGNENLSFVNRSDATSIIDKAYTDYSLYVTDNKGNLDTTFRKNTIKLKVEEHNVLNVLNEVQNAWFWPINILLDHNNCCYVNYDSAYIKASINNSVERYNNKAIKTENAKIEYNENDNEFFIKEAIQGDQYDTDRICLSINESIIKVNKQLDINENHYIVPQVWSDDKRLNETIENVIEIANCTCSLYINKIDVAYLNTKTLTSWISINDDCEINIEFEKIKEWCKVLGRQVDTIGSSRQYIRPDGKSITVSGGSYGFEIDEENLCNMLLEKLSSKNDDDSLNVPCLGDTLNFSGVGKQDWSNTYIDVDLSEQHAYMFSNRILVWEASIISGKPGQETNEGVWFITNKQSPSILIGEIDSKTGKPSYETKVEYWIPFVENMIGLHDANWQKAFGGSSWKQGAGSHGCVNLSESSAHDLYNICNINDVVIVHY